MGVNSLPKTVMRQRRGCDLNPGPSAPESSTLNTRLLSHPYDTRCYFNVCSKANIGQLNLPLGTINNKSTEFSQITLHINRFMHKRKVVAFFLLQGV